jgi:hypothetical protein
MTSHDEAAALARWHDQPGITLLRTTSATATTHRNTPAAQPGPAGSLAAHRRRLPHNEPRRLSC